MKMASSPVWANPFHLTPEQRRGEEACDGLYVPMSLAQTLAESGICATQLRMIVQWEHYIMNVKDVVLDKTVDVNGEPYALVTFGEEFDEYFVRSMARSNNCGTRATFFVNSTAFLCEPNSFVYDWHTGTVYVIPSDPERMARLSFGYTEQTNFFTFKGMKNVTVEGLTFTGLTSPYVCETGYYAKLSNNEKRVGRLPHAAILASDVRSLVIRNCVFLLIASLPCALGYNLWSGVHPFAGKDILDSEDYIVSNFLLPLGSLVYVLFCTSKLGWGFDNFMLEVNTGKGAKMKRWMKVYLKYILPVMILVLWIVNLINPFVTFI
jgi:hypothetical protein